MGSELAVMERLNQLQLSLDKVERTLATIVPTTVQARQTIEPGYLDLVQAADYLHTPAATVRRWARLKGLPYHKLGKELLFKVKDLDAWMNRHRKGLKGLALHGFAEGTGR